MTTTTDRPFPDLPCPVGAYEVRDWDPRESNRSFNGRSWVIPTESPTHRAGPDFTIDICGIQLPNNETARWIHAGPLHPDDVITSAVTRAISKALIEAADEYDATTSGDSNIPGWTAPADAGQR